MGKLKNKISISFSVLAILLSGVIILSLYAYVKQQVRESTRLRLMDIASTASLMIDGDLHATLSDPTQMTSADFLTIRNWLDQILLNNQNVLYAYTMRYVNGEIMFVADSIVGEDPADLGDIYEEAEPEFIDYVATASEPWADEDFTTDQWGTVLSGYAPIFTSDGRLDGIIGVDMAVEDVRAYENQFIWVSLFIFLVSIPLAALTGWLVGNRLAAPLIALIGDVERIGAGELDHRAQVTSRDEIAQLAERFNQMAERVQASIAELEARVAQRTRELEVRNQYLEATTQVGRSAAEILDMDELIWEVVEQIRQRFQLYYVGLFLTDTNQEWAVLRAGTGDAGQAMLQRGHRIRVGSGMIGWCIANGQPRIAQAAEQDAVRLATAELPETRSEAALPLRSRDQVLGAISVQSSLPGAFDEQTVRVLQSMADQVAIALDNAILFMQSQASLEAERRAIGRIGRESWEKLIQARQNLGYRLDGHKITPVQDAWNPEMAGAAQNEHPMQYGKGHLAIPVKLRGDTIAVLDLRKPGESQQWSQEEIAFVGNLAEQLGTALESARLFEETEQLAERERLIGEITSRMRAVPDIDNVLQSAARDMRRALNLAEVEVRVGALEEQPIAQTGYAHNPSETGPTGQNTRSDDA